jgi:hypothetical protein
MSSDKKADIEAVKGVFARAIRTGNLNSLLLKTNITTYVAYNIFSITQINIELNMSSVRNANTRAYNMSRQLCFL